MTLISELSSFIGSYGEVEGEDQEHMQTILDVQ